MPTRYRQQPNPALAPSLYLNVVALDHHRARQYSGDVDMWERCRAYLASMEAVKKAAAAATVEATEVANLQKPEQQEQPPPPVKDAAAASVASTDVTADDPEQPLPQPQPEPHPALFDPGLPIRELRQLLEQDRREAANAAAAAAASTARPRRTYMTGYVVKWPEMWRVNRERLNRLREERAKAPENSRCDGWQSVRAVHEFELEEPVDGDVDVDVVGLDEADEVAPEPVVKSGKKRKVGEKSGASKGVVVAEVAPEPAAKSKEKPVVGEGSEEPRGLCVALSSMAVDGEKTESVADSGNGSPHALAGAEPSEALEPTKPVSGPGMTGDETGEARMDALMQVISESNSPKVVEAKAQVA